MKPFNLWHHLERRHLHFKVNRENSFKHKLTGKKWKQEIKFSIQLLLWLQMCSNYLFVWATKLWILGKKNHKSTGNQKPPSREKRKFDGGWRTAFKQAKLIDLANDANIKYIQDLAKNTLALFTVKIISIFFAARWH